MSNLRPVMQLAVLLLLQGAMLFGAYGGLDWLQAWVYLLVLALFAALVIALGDPRMLEMRGSREENAKGWDIALASASGALFWFAPLIVCGLDRRFEWSPSLPAWTAWLALVGFAVGLSVGGWAMLANRFFSKFVQIQDDHQVIDVGPYAWVRHPGYAGALLAFAALPVALGSVIALAPAVAGLALLMLRTQLEDKTLQAELPGYAEYAQRVRFRLIPFVW